MSQKLDIGIRVRFIGNGKPFKNPILYALLNRTGVIKSHSNAVGCDWSVNMDEGYLDLDTTAEMLEPIDDNEKDCWFNEDKEFELV